MVLIKESFKNWDSDKLKDLIKVANSSGRFYGTTADLLCQFDVLKEKFEEIQDGNDISKWLTIFKSSEESIPQILHFALCSFVKIPLEATAETIGSVINSHGCKERCSLFPMSLSNEVQVVWNGPPEFHPETEKILKESLTEYFSGKSTGLRFYANTKLNLMSSTIAKYKGQASRILFSKSN